MNAGDALKNLLWSLAEDLQLLRDGKITNRDAQTRAQVAREMIRAAHLAWEINRVMMLPVPEKGKKNRLPVAETGEG